MSPQKPQTWNYGGFGKGCNAYDGSRSTIDNEEFTPVSLNAVPTGKGSVTKAPGASRFGGEVASGYAVMSGIQYVTSSIDRLIVHAGTGTKYYSGGNWVAMSGLTLSATKPAWFCQALDYLYCSQEGLGGLYVTTDGVSWSLVSNGRALVSLTFFNQRLYGIDPTTGYIWYSNPYGVTTDPPARSLSNFATFDTSLSASPKKNAGFIELAPGSGVIPTRLFYEGNGSSEALYVYTKRHGYWKISAVSTANADGSIAHAVFQSNAYFGSPAPLSIGKVGNDQWFFDGEMLNSNGEVALYQNIRVTPKFGKLRQYLRAINSSYLSSPALGFKDNTVYFAYPTGEYNDRLIRYDTVLGAPSSELTGFNCAFFLTYQDGNVKRLLYGSSDPSDSYVYELGSGTDVSPSFLLEPKSTDCGYPGRVKRGPKATVFYTSVQGTLSYRVIFEESRYLSGSQTVGSSTSRTIGLGSQPLGAFPLGLEFVSGTTLASTATNGYFDVDLDYEPFERITVQLSNSVTGESAQIDDIQYTFQLGSPFETLD